MSRKRKSVKRSIDWYQKFLISRLAARYSTVFVFYCTQNVKIDFLKFNLLPNEPIESFWDALWLGIRPLLCFTLQKGVKTYFLKFNSMPKAQIESFWDALWLGIRPFLCFA